MSRWIDLARHALLAGRYLQAEMATVEVWASDPDAGLQLVREQLDYLLEMCGSEPPYPIATAIARRCAILFVWRGGKEGIFPAYPRANRCAGVAGASPMTSSNAVGSGGGE